MTLPPITNRQQDILQLIYLFRFLDRTQIQSFLGHKDKKRINAWLNDLRDKQYLGCIYTRTLGPNTIPAVYFIGLNGLRYLKTTDYADVAQLTKRYRDSIRKPGFVARNLAIATCALDLQQASSETITYKYSMSTDYQDPASPHNFVAESGLEPALLIFERSGQKTKPYLLDIFDQSLPQYRIRTKLKTYLEFFRSGEWEIKTHLPRPILMFVCPDTHHLILTKRYLIRLMREQGMHLSVEFTTVGTLKTHGLLGHTWESG